MTRHIGGGRNFVRVSRPRFEGKFAAKTRARSRRAGAHRGHRDRRHPLPDGKFKVNSKGWDEEKVILPDQSSNFEWLPAGCGSRARPGTLTLAILPPPVEQIGAEGEIAEFE